MRAILDHVGIAVKNVEEALAFYRDGLGLHVEVPEEVASQRVRAHFIPAGQAALELLEPTNRDRALRGETRTGASPHHAARGRHPRRPRTTACSRSPPR